MEVPTARERRRGLHPATAAKRQQHDRVPERVEDERSRCTPQDMAAEYVRGGVRYDVHADRVDQVQDGEECPGEDYGLFWYESWSTDVSAGSLVRVAKGVRFDALMIGLELTAAMMIVNGLC